MGAAETPVHPVFHGHGHGHGHRRRSRQDQKFGGEPEDWTVYGYPFAAGTANRAFIEARLDALDRGGGGLGEGLCDGLDPQPGPRSCGGGSVLKCP
ncbi:hypothetical protein [Streptomyces sp. NPDC001809]